MLNEYQQAAEVGVLLFALFVLFYYAIRILIDEM